MSENVVVVDILRRSGSRRGFKSRVSIYHSLFQFVISTSVLGNRVISSEPLNSTTKVGTLVCHDETGSHEKLLVSMVNMTVTGYESSKMAICPA